MSSIGAGVKDAVSSAHTLLILGFGYLRQNLELLAPDGKKQVQRIISTAYQVSADDREVLTSSLKEFAASIHPMIIVDPVKCRDLFELHRLELSLR